MTVLTIVTVLFAAGVMGYGVIGKPAASAVESDAEVPRPRALPKSWSSLLIALTVLYCFLVLAGLSYAGWFRVA